MKTKLILLSCLLGMLTFADAPPEEDTRMKAANDVIEIQVLRPMRDQQKSASMFSRIALMPPVLDWGEAISKDQQAFEIRRQPGFSILGLYNHQSKEIMLYEVAEQKFVPSASHSVFRVSRNKKGS